MRLLDNMRRISILPAWCIFLAGGLLLSCFLAFSARADEWNDTFREPREFVVAQSITARSGPGNTYDTMGIVPEGTSIWVTDITNGWHCFKLIDGRSAYIFRRYLKPAETKKERKAAAASKAGKKEPKKEKKPAARAEKKESKAADKQPAGTRAKKAKQEAPKKAATKPAGKTVAETDGDYDEPIVQSEAKKQPDKNKEQEADNAPVTQQDPPDPPLLAEIPQGPEDEPVPPAKAEKQPAEVEDAVKPERRPVRSSSFGSDGCSSYQRIVFAPGKEETLLKGKLAAGKRLCYRFLGIEGNTVSLALKPADTAAAVDVFTPASGHVAEKQKSFSWRCVSTGDKVIVVHADKAASYTLQVKMQR